MQATDLLFSMDVNVASSPPTSWLIDPVKLVIWDLDETFWKGTLSEGPIEPSSINIEIVRLLATRGILSSICSKNDFDPVKSKLTELEIWDYFIFPTIHWSPKGALIKQLIESARLRPQNVVFIDDNLANLAEATQECPGLVCLSSPNALIAAINSPALKGAPDPDLLRLKQYQQLQARSTDTEKSSLTNVEFLRKSDITIQIRYDIDNHMDRIIELLNRSNQLNYTKIRLDTEEALNRFRLQLTDFGFKAGVVHLSDRYGDYGIVGFFMTLSTLTTYEIVHFVFSCRVINMGVEQYVYEYLNKPTLNVRGPVANDVITFDRVDWIKEAQHDHNLTKLKRFKLLLVGGCDMLQVSTYCSADSVEFTNRPKGDLMIRFDDPYFFLSNREVIKASKLRQQIPAWNADDMAEFDRHVSDVDLVLLSFYEMMTVTYFKGTDGLIVRFHEDTLKTILKSDSAIWFVRNFSHILYEFEERLELIRLCLETISRRTKPGARVVIISENIRRMDNRDEAGRRKRYNEYIENVCSQIPKLRYIELNQVTKEDWIFDGWHMTRQGYLELAAAVMATLPES